MVITEKFIIQTKGDTDIIDITQNVINVIEMSSMQSGAAIVFVAGSTASITTIEYEEGAVSDLKEAIERIAPKNIHYSHDARWGDGNGFAHVRASLLGASFVAPFTSKKLILGTGSRLY